MLVKPTVPELLKESKKNRYSLVIATAKRARQISQGSKPMTNVDDISPVSLAADEIGEGKVVIFDENQWKDEQEKLEEKNEDNANNDAEKENETSNSDSEENK